MGAKTLAGSALLLTTLLAAGCGSAPKPAEPPLFRTALEVESDGARRYARGEYIVAARRFEEAVRLYTSIDNHDGIARNRLHLARVELARGRAEAALALLDGTAGGIDGQLARAQAQLALGRHDAARQTLAATDCAADCAQAPSRQLLQAHVELAARQPAAALAHAQAAQAALKDKDEAAETANAWRTIAAAQLALGDTAAARSAATTALEIDRQLAVPEKIARDWLLIGDIETKVDAGDAAKQAYDRARAVAEAAGLKEAGELARRALGLGAEAAQAPK